MKVLILLLFLAQPVAAGPIWKPTPLRPVAEVEPDSGNNVDRPGETGEWAAPEAPDAQAAEEAGQPRVRSDTPSWAVLVGVGDLGLVGGGFLGGLAGWRLCPEGGRGQPAQDDWDRCGRGVALGALLGGVVGGALAIDLVGDALVELAPLLRHPTRALSKRRPIDTR